MRKWRKPQSVLYHPHQLCFKGWNRWCVSSSRCIVIQLYFPWDADVAVRMWTVCSRISQQAEPSPICFLKWWEWDGVDPEPQLHCAEWSWFHSLFLGASACCTHLFPAGFCSSVHSATTTTPRCAAPTIRTTRTSVSCAETPASSSLRSWSCPKAPVLLVRTVRSPHTWNTWLRRSMLACSMLALDASLEAARWHKANIKMLEMHWQCNLQGWAL